MAVISAVQDAPTLPGAAVLKLHAYLRAAHWDGRALIGPDPGIRFDYRIGRFVKSYLPRLSWNDRLYYLQAQGYWVLGNWLLFRQTGIEAYRDVALSCTGYILEQQREDGAWSYPNREWKGRTATVEGIWASLALLESYRATADPALLEGALRWHNFLIRTIGFQRVGDELAVNYFANERRDLRVPNNSSDALRFLAELTDVTGNRDYLEPCPGLLTFMQRTQKVSGEFPYAVEGETGGKPRPHFQCYQYNAFQCLGLSRYRDLTSDEAPLPMIAGALQFLRGGLSESGYAFYACGNQHRSVSYHTGVLAAAFTKAGLLGLDGYREPAERAYRYLLGLQRADGSFPYSSGDYRVLRDGRSYPRYLAMILFHLLQREPAPLAPAREADPARLSLAQEPYART